MKYKIGNGDGEDGGRKERDWEEDEGKRKGFELEGQYSGFATQSDS